jgi:two-component system sensor histidine kinase KdpD
MTESRPDPAQLLARAQREQSRVGRGRLKIFFGMAPGVGKTYAMLTAAKRLASEGVDVVVGVVETHGRTETEQLLLGLDLLPRRKIEYSGTQLDEFDLGAALMRKPEVLLIDELAHTNAPGSRFEKRWQDVQEVLKAGIDVFTTLNVQHVESLNDVVAQITSIAVRETVPDSVIEEADEVELVDLTPDALLERLRAGKVYVPENVRAAIDSFFRKGNLTALRELSLRRTAEWVDAQMRNYKEGQGIHAVWPAADRVLVCVSPSPSSADIVRAAKRIAAGLRADLLAAYVETPRAARLPQAERDRVLQTLRLAQSLGSQIVTLTTSPGSEDAASALVAFARSRNVSKIVIGKTATSRWRQALFGSFMDDVIRESGEIDVHVIRGEEDEGSREKNGAGAGHAQPRRRSLPIAYVGAIGLVLVCTALGALLLCRLDLANIVMVYLAGVVITAVWLGRGPAVVAAILGVAAFDFFFVPPRLTFAVSDIQYVLTFFVMLAVGLLIANLTTRLRSLAHTARQREQRTAALYAMTRELAAAHDLRSVATIAVRHVRDVFLCDAAVAVPQSGSAAGASVDVLAFAGSPDWLDEREMGVARWSFDHGKDAGAGTRALPAAAGRFVPLSGSEGKIAILGVHPHNPNILLATEQLLQLDSFANQIAMALERVMLIEGQQRARLEAESERVRSALLSSVSHDLRTPLASIAGAATALRDTENPIDAVTRRELIDSIVTEATRLNDLIANLVFATRLEAGGIDLRREWTTIEEIVGVGLVRFREVFANRQLHVSIPSDLPLVRVDNPMLAQVVHNLIENAIGHTPPDTSISVSAWQADANVVVRVADEGPGLSSAEMKHVFQRFYRGRSSPTQESSEMRGGMGLGLAICEGIMKAHGGRIWVEPNSPRGVAFLFSLPIEHPQPTIPTEPVA